jgi:hypothetical protein
MKIRDRRERATGRQGARGERFARMPQSLLESQAVASLPATAFKLLVLLALGARPPGLDPRKDKGSNGVQGFTFSYAQRYGFTSKDTLQRSLQVLLDRGLIIKTRDGWKSKAHFALYGVAWLPITHRDGQPLDSPELTKESWRTWSESSPIVGQDDPSLTVNLRPDSRAQISPMVGHDEAGSAPIVGLRTQICAPIVGDTLRNLGGDTQQTQINGPRAHQPAPNPSTATTQEKFAPTEIVKAAEKEGR